jgi:hypothetical protein
MTAIDGDLDGSGIDKVRMKIYNKNTGQVYYDNQPGASDAADPTCPVGTNSSVVVYNINDPVTTYKIENVEMPVQLEVRAVPNPSNGIFALTVETNDLKNPVQLQVTDLLGRVIGEKIIAPNSTIRLGEKYKTGVYIINVWQAKNEKQIKLVKTSGQIH